MFQAIAFETERLKFCAATPNDINIIRDNYLSESMVIKIKLFIRF